MDIESHHPIIHTSSRFLDISKRSITFFLVIMLFSVSASTALSIFLLLIPRLFRHYAFKLAPQRFYCAEFISNL